MRNNAKYTAVQQLKKELGKYKKKVEDQAKAEARHKKIIADMQEEMTLWSTTLDACIIELAKNYGEKTESGYRISTPLVSLKMNRENFTVKGFVGEDNDSYVFDVINKTSYNEEDKA